MEISFATRVSLSYRDKRECTFRARLPVKYIKVKALTLREFNVNDSKWVFARRGLSSLSFATRERCSFSLFPRLRNNEGKVHRRTRSLPDRQSPKATREIGFRELGFTLNFMIDHRRSHVPSIFSGARSSSGRIPPHASHPATGCSAQRENRFPIDARLQESRVGGRTPLDYPLDRTGGLRMWSS